VIRFCHAGLDPASIAANHLVIPAKAGILGVPPPIWKHWVPASAGTTT
jgi:hypothetical protein